MSPIRSLLVVVMVLTICFMFVRTVKADTVKVGEGPFVMAVSYTDSYKDLQYVANFANCDMALAYYDMNCATQGAMIMMCQLEDKLYMPLNHDSTNEFSSFDFEINTNQSCGFVGVQKNKFVEE